LATANATVVMPRNVTAVQPRSDLSPNGAATTVQSMNHHRADAAVTAKLMAKVTSSRYGYNMFTSTIESTRTCEMAGVPSEFCGCNLLPCSAKIRRLIKSATGRKEIIQYINDKVRESIVKHALLSLTGSSSSNSSETAKTASSSVDFTAVYNSKNAVYNNKEKVYGVPKETYKTLTSICKPLEVSEVIFTPGLEDCLANDQIIVVNAFIQRQMRLISITFEVIKDESNPYVAKSSFFGGGGGLGGQANDDIRAIEVVNVNTISPYRESWGKCSNRITAANVDVNYIEEEAFQYCYCDTSANLMSTFAGIISALDF
jgi:hypothetical protein